MSTHILRHQSSTLTEKEPIQRKETRQSHLTQFLFVQVRYLHSSEELPAGHVSIEEEGEICNIIIPVISSNELELVFGCTIFNIV